MGWRVVVVENKCKITYRAGYLILKKEEDKMIHLSEIDYILLSSTQVCITAVAINEIVKNNIHLVFCDEKHNPLCEINKYYGSYNCSLKLKNQLSWSNEIKNRVFDIIITYKIMNQAKNLLDYGCDQECKMLMEYVKEVNNGDETNREGHAAKIYFNRIFKKGFSRNEPNSINSALNYGYTILLSYINREIILNGCLTQLGLKHCNEFNQFNLSCDLIEPFRPIVDRFVKENNPGEILDSDYKNKLIGLLCLKFKYKNKEMYLSDIISNYVKNVLDALETGNIENISNYEF